MSVQSGTYGSTITTTEILPAAATPAASSDGNRTVTHNGFNSSVQVAPSGTTPVVNDCSYLSATVGGGGSDTVDLTNVPGVTAAKDFSTKKVMAFKILNTGANPITITPGGSNAYLLLGAGFSATIPPGGELFFASNSGSPTVDATHKNITVTGTAGQPYKIGMQAG